jgi:hypothetical protein
MSVCTNKVDDAITNLVITTMRLFLHTHVDGAARPLLCLRP